MVGISARPSDRAAKAWRGASADRTREGSELDNERARWIGLLEGQSRLVELIAKGAGLEQTLERLGVLIETVASSARCAIMLRDAEDDHLERVMAPSLPTEFKAALKEVSAVGTSGPLEACAVRREPVTIVDVAAERRWPEFVRLLRQFEFSCCAMQPILGQDGKTLAVIVLCYSELHALETDDCRMVDALCPLARIAIESYRRVNALESTNERFASIAASIPGVLYQRVVDLDTADIRYTYISEGARDFFGVSPEEILADPNALFDCHGPEFRATFRENLLSASRDLTMWDVEAPIIARGGKHKWSHAIARPRRLPDGSVLWSGVILDATRIKEANLALAASSRAKSDFLANMSHELRTPLNAIIGFSDVIRNELFGELKVPQYKSYVDDIHASGVHLLKLINDILDVAKIEAGKLELDDELVDLRELIGTSLRLVRERAESQSVDLGAEFPAVTPALLGDELKLKQILLNLLSNAIKFTLPGGKATVRVSLADNGGLTIVVSDTGIGIPPEYIGRAFHPFVQVDSGLNRKFNGTGLGLTLTKAMVELHGGTIELASALGRGTSVTMRFPPERTRTQ
jgi:signal transduction histidine kinase